jgi:hypothetical protein
MTKNRNRKYIWLLIPAIFSLLVLAAHFSRQNQTYIGILALGLIPLLFLKKSWVLWSVQIALFIGSLEWVRSTLKYIEIRQQIGEDWHRLAIILFSVAAFTLISGLLLLLPAIRKRYNIPS